MSENLCKEGRALEKEGLPNRLAVAGNLFPRPAVMLDLGRPSRDRVPDRAERDAELVALERQGRRRAVAPMASSAAGMVVLAFAMGLRAARPRASTPVISTEGEGDAARVADYAPKGPSWWGLRTHRDP